MIILYSLAVLLLPLLLYVLFLSVCALFVNPKKEYTSNSPFYRRLLYSATAFAVKLLRIRIHITGQEKLPQGEKILFVGNHCSNFDPLITWHVHQKWDIAFISKASNFKIPFFGRIIRKCCFMAIDRENPRKAIVTINNAAKLLKEQEVSIGVYPEGTRSKSGALLPFHNSVFKIAQKANAPIAVISLSGTTQIHRNIPFRATDVYLDVLEVIPAEHVINAKTEMIGKTVRHLLETNQEKRLTNGKNIHTP